MTYLNDFITLGVINLLGAMSPGPDFVIVTQQSLKYGKKAGIYTSLGITLGCLVHITYCIIGVGVIIAESVVAFNIIKYLGAAYLIYIGIKGILSKAPIPETENLNPTIMPTESISAWEAIRKGFFVNVLNPKAGLFFLSIFTQVIDPDMPLWVQALLGLELSLIGFVWFSILACILNYPTIKQKLQAIQHYIDRVLGVVLVIFGIKIATFTA